MEEGKLRNSKNKKLLCLLLTAAMLIQPMAVSASAPAGDPAADRPEIQEQETPAAETDIQTGENITGQEDLKDDEAPADQTGVQPADPAADPAEQGEQKETAEPETLPSNEPAAEETDGVTAAAEENGGPEADPETAQEAKTPVLQDGQAVIPAGSDPASVKLLLADALLGNCGDFTEEELLALDWQYFCEGKTKIGTWGNRSWGSVEGFQTETGKLIKTQYTHPALADNGDGDYQVRLAGTDAEVTLSKKAVLDSSILLKDGISVGLPWMEDGSVDYEQLKRDVFQAAVERTTPELTPEDVNITYYATAKSGSVGSMGKNWAPLSGGKVSGLDYPGIPAGVQTVRISWPGSRVYAPTVIQAEVEVLDREQVQFQLQEAPYEAGLVFTPEQGYDYEATAKAIYDAVIASVSPEVDYEKIQVEYNTDLTGLTHISYKPLGEKDATGLVRFKDGTWEIRISCGDTVEYRGNAITVKVTVSDNRIVSRVVLNDNVSFTYHMDPAVMRQAVYDRAVNWENSELPARETVSMEDFEILYKAQIDVLDSRFDAGKLGGLLDKIPGLEGVGGSVEEIAGSLNDSTKRWMPLEGGEYLGVPYAPMGAGPQQIQIVYKGNAEYRPSDAAEGTVTVNKANVKVSVHSNNIYADQQLPAGFITTDPADQFDFYTIYAGATSNVSLGLYLDLPDKFDNNRLIRIMDPVVEKITGRSFSKMMQDGMTVGELRSLFDSTELLELLDKVGVDTGAFGQILKVINAMPSALDGTRIGFGTPGRAGLYTVTVITDNKNYNTGVGVGALLVRMRSSGVKLNWNENLGSKISAADAKNFDFGATLSYNGDVSISQDNVHYLYSGFTSKFRVYSSTTTPPTEPGRYVVTVVTLGGNYQAFPITRSFQITK